MSPMNAPASMEPTTMAADVPNEKVTSCQVAKFIIEKLDGRHREDWPSAPTAAPAKARTIDFDHEREQDREAREAERQ